MKTKQEKLYLKENFNQNYRGAVGGRYYHPLLISLEPNRRSNFSALSWRPDEVLEHTFPKSKIEIFVDF